MLTSILVTFTLSRQDHVQTQYSFIKFHLESVVFLSFVKVVANKGVYHMLLAYECFGLILC